MVNVKVNLGRRTTARRQTLARPPARPDIAILKDGFCFLVFKPVQ